MGLPASQVRALGRVETGLRADEPHLASMFGIFARLAADEPVSTERLVPGPRWWRRPPGAALYAMVLVPVIFALVIIGALLGSGAHTFGTCDVGYSAGRGAAQSSRPPCQAVRPAGPGAIPGQASACPPSAAPASHSATHTARDLAFPPAAGSPAAAGYHPEMCYK